MSNNKENSGFMNKMAENSHILLGAVVVFVLLLALVPILITKFNSNTSGNSDDSENTGRILSGTYALEIQNAGSSKYFFDGNRVTNIYNDTTVEYTYAITVENGVEVIKLTTTDESGNPKTTTHEFYEGSMGDRTFISINDSYYYLQENAE